MQNIVFLSNRDYKIFCEFSGACFGAKLTLFLKTILHIPIIVKLHCCHNRSCLSPTLPVDPIIADKTKKTTVAHMNNVKPFKNYFLAIPSIEVNLFEFFSTAFCMIYRYSAQSVEFQTLFNLKTRKTTRNTLSAVTTFSNYRL